MLCGEQGIKGDGPSDAQWTFFQRVQVASKLASQSLSLQDLALAQYGFSDQLINEFLAVLSAGFLQLLRVGPILCYGAQGFSLWGLLLLWCPGSRCTSLLWHIGWIFVACRLESAGSVVVVPGLSCSLHVESSWTRDWTHVPCIGRRILIHCTSREVPTLYDFNTGHPVPALWALLCSSHANVILCQQLGEAKSDFTKASEAIYSWFPFSRQFSLHNNISSHLLTAYLIAALFGF